MVIETPHITYKFHREIAQFVKLVYMQKLFMLNDRYLFYVNQLKCIFIPHLYEHYFQKHISILLIKKRSLLADLFF